MRKPAPARKEQPELLTRPPPPAAMGAAGNKAADAREHDRQNTATDAAVPSRFGVHVRGASRGPGETVLQRRCGTRRFASLSALPRSEFPIRFRHLQLGGVPAAPADPAGTTRRASPHEIYKWPTKCSSTRPIRRR